MTKKMYTYHIAFNSYNQTTGVYGFGMIFIDLAAPMNTVMAVKSAQRIIEKQYPGSSIVILNWNLLDAEGVVA